MYALSLRNKKFIIDTTLWIEVAIHNQASMASRAPARPTQQPLNAWDDPKDDYRASPDDGGAAVQSAVAKGLLLLEEERKEGRGDQSRYHDHRRQGVRRSGNQASFYDREALQEQLQSLQTERRDLSEKEGQMYLRLKKAQATLSAMRIKKRNLSENKMLDEAVSVVSSKGKDVATGQRSVFRERKDRQTSDSNRQEKRKEQREEEINFSTQDRIMQLDVLNDQLKKGQAGAEREAKMQQADCSATRAELKKVSERLNAMPKRFTQSLSQLREEVDRLEREKLSLELAKQQRSLKEADLIAVAKRQQAYLGEELTSLLDEIDDVEDDRDRWKRRLRVESARAESLRSQRDEAVRTLRDRFGNDAVERAAFACCACSLPLQTYPPSEGGGGGGGGGERWSSPRRTPGGHVGSSYEGVEDGDEKDHGGSGSGSGNGVSSDQRSGSGSSSSGGCDTEERIKQLPVTMIAEALAPAYGPACDYLSHDGDGAHGGGHRGEGVLLTAEAIAGAVESVCDIDCSAMNEEERGRVGLTFEQFLAVANRLKSGR